MSDNGGRPHKRPRTDAENFAEKEIYRFLDELTVEQRRNENHPIRLRRDPNDVKEAVSRRLRPTLGYKRPNVHSSLNDDMSSSSDSSESTTSSSESDQDQNDDQSRSDDISSSFGSDSSKGTSSSSEHDKRRNEDQSLSDDTPSSMESSSEDTSSSSESDEGEKHDQSHSDMKTTNTRKVTSSSFRNDDETDKQHKRKQTMSSSPGRNRASESDDQTENRVCIDLVSESSEGTSCVSSSDVESGNNTVPTVSAIFRSKQKFHRLNENIASESDDTEDNIYAGDSNEQATDQYGAASASPACSEGERGDDADEWSDSDGEGGTDIDEEEEERLVRQVNLPRATSNVESCDEADDINADDEAGVEVVEQEEEVEAKRANGRLYEIHKTYFRTCNGATYMYAILKLDRRPNGRVYAECAQVLKLAGTFLSSVESQLYECVRLAGLNKFPLDQRFGEQVGEIEGIPRMIYEINRGKRLHFAFYPPSPDNVTTVRLSSKATALDLFAGAGAMHLGFHAAGFETAMAVEKNPFAAQALSSHVNRIFPGDVVDFLTACKSKSYRDQIGPIHHLHASPPCQGFSGANRTGGRNDHANRELSLQFLEGAKLFKPVTATYEMVTGILWEKHRPYLETIMLGLIEEGYKVRCCILNASDYGDPQNRRRLFLFAASAGIPLPRVPRATHGESRHLFPRQTVSDAIGGLPRPPTSSTSKMEYHGSVLYNTWHPKTVAVPGDPDVVVLDPNEPSSTIRGGSRPPLHYEPKEDENGEPKYRCISLREMAMLQSFPKDFQFWGNRTEQRKQVGNAVPVKLANAVAKSVRDALTFVK